MHVDVYVDAIYHPIQLSFNFAAFSFFFFFSILAPTIEQWTTYNEAPCSIFWPNGAMDGRLGAVGRWGGGGIANIGEYTPPEHLLSLAVNPAYSVLIFYVTSHSAFPLKHSS